MTDLEERVRDALRAQAGEFTVSPDAWQRTKARAARRTTGRGPAPAGQGWLARFTPLAVAAAVLGIGIGTAVLAGTGGFTAITRGVGLGPGPGSTPQATPSSFGGRPPRAGPCTRVIWLATGAPRGVPAGAVSYAGVIAWFSQLNGRLWLCTAHRLGGNGSYVGTLGHGTLAVDVAGGGPVAGQTRAGAVVKSATSVEAMLANGHDVQGAVKLGHGFPYAVWWVSYPAADSATLVFRDAAGHVVTRLHETTQPPPSHRPQGNPLEHPVLLTPSDVLCGGPSRRPPSQLVRVRQVMDGIKVWTYVRFVYPVDSGPVAPQLCEAAGVVGDATTYQSDVSLSGQLVQAVNVLSQTSTVSGVAIPGVASVTAVLADGRQYTGTFATGKGFPYQVWLVSYPVRDPATLIFRDAAGHEVAILHTSANVWPVS
jgi:hypothetical protein